MCWSGLRGLEWVSGRGRSHQASTSSPRARAPKCLCLLLPPLTSTHFPALPSPDSPLHMPPVPCSHTRDMQDPGAQPGKGAKPYFLCPKPPHAATSARPTSQPATALSASPASPLRHASTFSHISLLCHVASHVSLAVQEGEGLVYGPHTTACPSMSSSDGKMEGNVSL